MDVLIFMQNEVLINIYSLSQGNYVRLLSFTQRLKADLRTSKGITIKGLESE